MPSEPGRTTAAKVVVATTVALSFNSFWRAAAVVLSDLASSAFYAGGIAEHAIGKSAPWFILGVMLFSFAVRSVYMESSSMFVRGGVYVVVRDSMGPFVARLPVSSNTFAAFFGVAVTIYFWWSNIKGIHESSTKALRIMQITTVMVVAFLIWCGLTLLKRGPAQIPPAPLPSNLEFSHPSADLGWLAGTRWIQMP